MMGSRTERVFKSSARAAAQKGTIVAISSAPAPAGGEPRVNFLGFDGAPERIRTSDPQIRSLVLYPAELRARGCRVTAGARHRGRSWPAQPWSRGPENAWTCQPLRIAAPQIEAVQPLARSAKSSANFRCHARAVSVTARWAAIRSSIARRL